MSEQGDLMKKAIEVLAAEYHAKTESVLILSKLPVAEAARLRESFATQVTGRDRVPSPLPTKPPPAPPEPHDRLRAKLDLPPVGDVYGVIPSQKRTRGQQVAESLFKPCDKGTHTAVKLGDHWICLGGKVEGWEVSRDLSKVREAVADAIDAELTRRDRKWQDAIRAAVKPEADPFTIEPETVADCIQCVRSAMQHESPEAAELRMTAKGA